MTQTTKPKLEWPERYCIKVDTEAIKRNGERPKNLEPFEYEPAIEVVKVDQMGEPVEHWLAHTVLIKGKSSIIQNDNNPGCKGKDHRSARVWVATEGPIELENYHD